VGRPRLGQNGGVRRGLLIVCAAFLLAPAGGASSLPLPTRLANALAVPGNSSDASGAVVVDLQTGQLVFARHPDLPLAPASNEKLTVSFTALHELGTAYRFRTEVFGRGYQENGVWHGDVFLKGFGDPTLSSLQVERLATQIAKLGIRRIAGRVYGDETWFDSRRTGPGWKASYYIDECPPLSALIVDRGWYDHHTAHEPALAAVGELKLLLRKHDVASGVVGLGRAPDGATALAQVESAPLPVVVAKMDRESDNFIAEMLLKEIGAEVGTAGTTAAGATVVRRDLVAAGVPLGGVRILDGSGLSLGDRLTARTVAALLTAAWDDVAVRNSFWGSLPIAGISGTLDKRLRRAPARGAVRAKTGTTDRASALSGYVRDRYGFAVLQNGWPVRRLSAEKAQDRFATALASASG
jgi:D-alanyl-D-alanine carboxypeptidase/D-alanyl-D-alanine-endopeptidase (penicillin-binding protein 4)